MFVQRERWHSTMFGPGEMAGPVRLPTIIRPHLTDQIFFSQLTGQLGLNDRKGRKTPTLVKDLLKTDPTDLAAGRNHMLCTTSAGHLYCWGDGKSGALGRGDWGQALAPLRVAALRTLQVVRYVKKECIGPIRHDKNEFQCRVWRTSFRGTDLQ